MDQQRQRITLVDVAREAGVSAMTVSRVINNTGRVSQATRQRVRDTIVRLGYRPNRPARMLVTNQTYLIGVIVPDITNPYFSKIVQGIENIAWESGYSVLLANTNENPAREEAILSQIDESAVDGLIVCSSRMSDDILLPLLESHRAAVVINRKIPHHLANCVRSRHGLGYRANQSARFLAQAGHERIGYIHLKRSAAMDSIDAFIARLAADHIPIKPEWCASCLPIWEAGYQTGQQLLTAHPELTAIIGGNDLVALGVMRAALDMGRRIPDDLAVIGGDDILLASQITPSLTTFHVPTYEVGSMAARLLFQKMQGDTSYQEYLYDETLIQRDSAP
ncbi:MAG: LacI family DNA-binding transcriptional regulator [Anaerolineae bacterium]|nr:LacI family DNA-binding transcriptional regulator [Anaerolineae bacterium]